ncbi:MAG: glycosyltransferase, exosortase A system-associated, partial [Alphaproteobacteria bacterium]|nr:glycosyltransferase, exosortase A system-associated [Alphaproteobacteria bacterium]
MRILHILDHSLPMHSGYTFRTRAIMKAQQAIGWDVSGVTGVRHAAKGPDVEISDGLTFYRTQPLTPLPPPIGEWREIRVLAGRISDIVNTFKPDIIHAHSPVLSGLAGLRAARKARLPFIYEIRAFWEDAAVGNGTGREGSARYRATKALETWVCRHADAVVVICDGLKRDLMMRGISKEKITVSPNGVDLELFGTPASYDTALAEELSLNGKNVVGFVGSFYDYEGLDILIEAMPTLIETTPDAYLLLVGGGPMEAALRAQAESSFAAGHIHFIGRVPHDTVGRYYSLIDVLTYPRKAMRLTDLVTPLKPLEAMAQRR